MTRLRNILLAGILTCGLSASAAELLIDQAHSEVAFSVKHMMISNVKGKFKEFDGDIDFDIASKTFKSFDATVNAKTIDTGIKDRDDHLRSADFFDVPNHPELRFVMKEYKKLSDSNGILVGDLTMRGVTKAVELNTTINGVVKDFTGKTKVGFSIDGKVNRKDFGLNWNKMIELGGVAVGDDVLIQVEIEATVIED